MRISSEPAPTLVNKLDPSCRLQKGSPRHMAKHQLRTLSILASLPGDKGKFSLWTFIPPAPVSRALPGSSDFDFQQLNDLLTYPAQMDIDRVGDDVHTSGIRSTSYISTLYTQVIYISRRIAVHQARAEPRRDATFPAVPSPREPRVCANEGT